MEADQPGVPWGGAGESEDQFAARIWAEMQRRKNAGAEAAAKCPPNPHADTHTTPPPQAHVFCLDQHLTFLSFAGAGTAVFVSAISGFLSGIVVCSGHLPFRPILMHSQVPTCQRHWVEAGPCSLNHHPPPPPPCVVGEPYRNDIVSHLGNVSYPLHASGLSFECVDQWHRSRSQAI